MLGTETDWTILNLIERRSQRKHRNVFMAIWQSYSLVNAQILWRMVQTKNGKDTGRYPPKLDSKGLAMKWIEWLVIEHKRRCRSDRRVVPRPLKLDTMLSRKHLLVEWHTHRLTKFDPKDSKRSLECKYCAHVRYREAKPQDPSNRCDTTKTKTVHTTWQCEACGQLSMAQPMGFCHPPYSQRDCFRQWHELVEAERVEYE